MYFNTNIGYSGRSNARNIYSPTSSIGLLALYCCLCLERSKEQVLEENLAAQLLGFQNLTHIVNGEELYFAYKCSIRIGWRDSCSIVFLLIFRGSTIQFSGFLVESVIHNRSNFAIRKEIGLMLLVVLAWLYAQWISPTLIQIFAPFYLSKFWYIKNVCNLYNNGHEFCHRRYDDFRRFFIRFDRKKENSHYKRYTFCRLHLSLYTLTCFS